MAFTLDERWKWIRSYLPKKSRILDAGCGAGEWVDFLNINGYQAEGLDYSKDLINKLKEHKPQYHWYNGNILDIPIENNEFDGIISWGVIEHDEKGPLEAIKEFHRILKNGGMAIVTVPHDCKATRKASEMMFPQKKVKDSGGHFFQYYIEVGELKKLFEDCGFKVHLSKSIGGPSLALVSPGIYKKVLNWGPIFRMINLVVKLIGPRSKEYDHNILCVAEKV